MIHHSHLLTTCHHIAIHHLLDAEDKPVRPESRMLIWIIRLVALAAILIFSSHLSYADIISGVPRVPTQKLTPEQHLAIAVQLLQNGQLDKARQRLTEYLGDAPNQPHPEILLARLLNQLGHAPEARLVLENLAVKEPNRIDVHLVFADLAIREGRWMDGWVHIAAAETAKPYAHWSDKHLNAIRQDLQMLKATCCEGRGEWKTARELYTSITTANQAQSIAAMLGLGRAEFHLNNPKGASQQFEKAWKLDATLDPPELAVALLFDAGGNQVEAEIWMQQAIKHPDAHAQARSRMACARLLIYQNRPSDAASALRNSFADEELEQERLYLNAMAARMEQRLDDARQLLSELNRRDPTTFSVSNQLALVLIENTDESLRGRALQIAVANVRNHPQMADAWSTLGWIQFRLGDLAAAQESLGRSMSASTASRDTAWYMAELHQKLGNSQQAEQLRNAALNAKGPMFTRVESSNPPPKE